MAYASRWTQDAEIHERLKMAGPELFALVVEVARWKVREDGMVYSDEPLDGHLEDARALVAWDMLKEA